MKQFEIRNRIRELKHQQKDCWCIETYDEIAQLQHSISSEMGVPHYLRV